MVLQPHPLGGVRLHHDARVCHLDTCPVGVATQNPELRKRFTGDPAHVVNFMRFVAQELREIMAQLGFRTINEMIGRTDKLQMKKAIEHWKQKGLDYSKILYQPKVGPGSRPLLHDGPGSRAGRGARSQHAAARASCRLLHLNVKKKSALTVPIKQILTAWLAL